jgi:hypothetical protein
MVATFNNARVQIKICYALVCGRMTKTDTGEVMMVQLASTGACAFDADFGSECLWMSDV